jgi:hypothetical protein
LSLSFCTGSGKKLESQVTWTVDKTDDFATTHDGRRYAEKVSRYAVCHLQM